MYIYIILVNKYKRLACDFACYSIIQQITAIILAFHLVLIQDDAVKSQSYRLKQVLLPAKEDLESVH